MRAARLALTRDEASVASAAVTRHVLALRPFQSASTVAIYGAIQGEIDPSGVIAPLQARGGSVCYPRIDALGLCFHLVSAADTLEPDRWGIPTPAPELPVVAPDAI